MPGVGASSADSTCFVHVAPAKFLAKRKIFSDAQTCVIGTGVDMHHICEHPFVSISNVNKLPGCFA